MREGEDVARNAHSDKQADDLKLFSLFAFRRVALIIIVEWLQQRNEKEKNTCEMNDICERLY